MPGNLNTIDPFGPNGYMFIVILSLFVHLVNEQNVAFVLAIMNTLIRDKVVKVEYFVERVVPQMLPLAFRRIFRMFPDTMNKLIDFVLSCPRMYRRRQNRKSIPRWKKVYMTLSYLGSMTSTYKLACLFGVSEEAFIRATDDVMLSLLDNINTFIRWPEKQHYPTIADHFNEMGRFFPNVIGCLDGCHLEISVGKRERNFYRNFKGYMSINLMAIVTYNMSFLDIFVGWPGRSHDSRVFEEAPVSARLQGLLSCPDRIMPAETYHLLADKGFTLVQEIMTPYKGKTHTLTLEQRKFNRHLNSKRHTVERAFSLLKRRFQRLHFLNQRSHKKAIKVVMACCILHNFCIGEDDNIDHYMTNILRHPPVKITDVPRAFLATDLNKDRGRVKRNVLARIIRRH